MDEILQHGERLMFRGIAEAGSGARPTATVAVRSFAVKGSTGIGNTSLPSSPVSGIWRLSSETSSARAQQRVLHLP